ncbi:MAG: T9SS type A sorting domain-containing protein [Bacteroidetes bacterium]|nr:T9SS type A sorting domain-containing protein [Bacteroidota bacterium]
MIRTADYGATWDTCQASINGPIFNSLMHDGNLYVYGNADTLVSTDNGFTWLPGSLPDYRLWRPGVILPNGNKVGLDLNGEIFTYFPSTGVSVITNTGIANSQFISIYSDNNVLFVSTYRGLFRSTDAGNTWNIVYNQPAHAMLFMGDTVLAVQAMWNSRFLRSFDHGITWDTLPLPTYSSSFQTVVAELNGKIYVSGNDIIYTDDLGLSWDTLPELPIVIGGTCLISNYELSGKIQVAYGKLFCVTDNGYVFEFDFTSQNWILNSCFSSSAFSQNEMHLADGKLVLSGGMGFFTSSDSGLTWIESTYNGVPPGEAPFGLLSIDSVWFSTARYDGVIFSTDFGQTWATIDSVPAFFALNQMCSLNNVLYVLSYFDGAFRRQNVFYSVSGNVFYDANNNGIKDSGENGIAHALISTNPASYIASTDTAGNYTLYTDINGLIEAIPPSTYTTVNPSSYVSSGTASGVDFGFYIAPGINDLQADLTNASVFSPGFNTTLILNAKNIGSAISSPVFTLLLDSNLILESSIPAPALTNGDTIVWNMSSINFMEEVSVSAIVKTDIGTPLGTPITCSLKVEPDINDVTPADNISVINSVVLASFDPNDKTCLQGEFYSTVQLSNSEELVYIVRFQNTGNLTTSFVNITDTLSSLLDLSTFRMVSTSHLCNWTLSNTGILRVEFNPIALPPSSVDELASHGFIKYAINCKESVVAGNAIANQAQIYFDFNIPIATNQVVTLLHEPGIVSVSDPVQITEEIVAYPNPTNNFVNFHFANSSNNESSIVKVYNMMGAFMSEKSVIGKSGKIDVSSFPAGIYVTVIYNSSGKRLGSFRFVRVD